MKNEQLRPSPRTPLPERLDLDNPKTERIMAEHEQACARNQQGYLDPFTGLFVMTADFHIDRGYCCTRGCRHCPFTQD